MAKSKEVKKIAIIGAGPAGITAAYTLAKNGVKVDLYEASPFVGGMARSIELWGQTVDIGPHRFFSSDPRVNGVWLEVIGRDYEMVNRLTRLIFRNKFYYYPVRAGDALKNLGVVEAARCIFSYAAQRTGLSKPDSKGTFEEWVTTRFGKRLYQHFFKTYSEKLWGIPCTQLDADFAAQRIKKLSMYEAIKSALFGGGGEKHKTLVDQFAYPKKGTGEVYERMRDHILKNGGKIYMKTPVKAVVNKGKEVSGIELESGKVRDYDQVISSMPITLLLDRLGGVPAEVRKANQTLKFRNTVIVYLLVKGGKLFPDNWIYVHSADLRMGRITNFRNWVPSINRGKKDTILALEYWCFDEDDFWHWQDKQYIDLAKEEIVKTGLVKPGQIKDGKVVRVPKCYPVYGRGYQKPLKKVENFLRQFKNLQVIGRYGAFKYNNQDHSILMGLLAAENVLGNGPHDIWGINTDYEYQESSKITKTGLVSLDK
ncbi:MAG TPA: FAD-dependent oxidoreductase [Candidatus Saccharimonadales bacterium]|nr:FAD-dependent oxidoreductase [Candidatus Saccharimonadales bacterium]